MGLNMQKLKENFDKKSERGDRFNIQNGENYVRILPPSIQYLTEEVDYICYNYLMHYRLGVEGDKQAAACPKTAGKHQRCPICEAVARLYKNDTVEDKALAGDIRAKKRHIFNVIDLNNPEKGIQIMETGPKLYEDLIVYVTNPKWGDLLDLDTGKNVVITKTDGKESATGYTEYRITPDPTSSSVRKVLPENFKEQIGLLQKAVPTPLTYDELKVILEGGVLETAKKPVEAESEEKEPEEPAVQKSAPAVKTTEKVQEVKEPSQGGQPSCFAKDYGPRREECLKCGVKAACREKFLEV